MYLLTRSYRRTDRRAGRWEPFDVSNEPVSQIATQHGDVWLFITYPALQGSERAVRFDALQNLTQGVETTTTVQQWLTALGNRTLPFVNELPALTEHYVKYVNAWHSDYVIEAIGRGNGRDSLASKWDKEDIFIAKEGVTPEYLRRHAMFSVNGFFHIAEYGPEGVYIRDANRSVRLANQNLIGVHSFADVGALDYVPITDDMITAVRPDTSLLDGMYITVPDTVELTGKTVLLVLGGYLQVLGKTYTRVGDRSFRLHLGSLSLPDRYYDSRDYIDLSSLNFTQYETNPDMLSVSEMKRDSTIRAYATLSQSFLVVVDTPTMFQDLVPVEPLFVGAHVENDFQQFPLIGTYGKTMEYHVTTQGDNTVIHTDVNRRHRYLYKRRPWRESPAIDNGRYPALPFTNSPVYWRVLGTTR